MKNWVISRPGIVNPYQCFLLLGKHCLAVKLNLTCNKNDTIDRWNDSSSKKTIKTGRNSKWYRPNQVQHASYPRPSFYDFSIYENESNKEQSSYFNRISEEDQRAYIRSCYNNVGEYQSLDFASFGITHVSFRGKTSEEKVSEKINDINLSINEKEVKMKITKLMTVT